MFPASTSVAVMVAALIVVLAAPATAQAAAAWTAQTGGLGYDLRDVSFVSATHGWAVGGSGTILRTVDGGATWQTQSSGTSQRLNDVHFVDASNGWAVGDGGVILRTSNGGVTWTPQASGTTADLSAVAFVDANRGWVASWIGGKIMSTVDGGAVWSPVDTAHGADEVEGVRPQALAFVSATQGWAVGFGILRTTDGLTWSRQSLPAGHEFATLWGVSFVSATEGWAVGWDDVSQGIDRGVILHTADGGDNWTVQDSSGARSLYGVAFVSPSEGWAVGADIYHTTDGGAHWTAQTTRRSGNPLGAVSFAGPTRGWAVDSRGGVLAYGDPAPADAPGAPQGWIERFSDPGVGSIDDMSFVDGGNGAALANGWVLTTTDGGATWTKRVSPSSVGTHGHIAMGDGRHIWIGGGSASQVHASADGGLSWTPQATGLTEQLSDISAADATHAWAVDCAQSKVSRVAGTSDGSTWRVQFTAPGTPSYLQGLHFVDAQHGWAVGGRFPPGGVKSQIFSTSDGGATWAEQDNPGVGKLRGVAFVDGRHGWVGGYEASTLMRTIDGVTWQQVASPFADPLMGFTSAARGVAIGWPEGAWVQTTSDAGDTWARNRFPCLLRSVCTSGGRYQWLGGYVPGPTGPIGKIWVLDTSPTTPTTPTAPLPVAKTLAKLSRPTLKPVTPRRGRAFYVSGTCRPAHTARTALSLRVERQSGRSWRKAKAVSVRINAGKTTYRVRFALSRSGRYRVRAAHGCGAHRSSYSVWRAFRVR